MSIEQTQTDRMCPKYSSESGRQSCLSSGGGDGLQHRQLQQQQHVHVSASRLLSMHRRVLINQLMMKPITVPTVLTRRKQLVSE